MGFVSTCFKYLNIPHYLFRFYTFISMNLKLLVWEKEFHQFRKPLGKKKPKMLMLFGFYSKIRSNQEIQFYKIRNLIGFFKIPNENRLPLKVSKSIS